MNWFNLMLIRYDDLSVIMLKIWFGYRWKIDSDRKSWIMKKIFKLNVKIRKSFINLTKIREIEYFINSFIREFFKNADRTTWWTERIQSKFKEKKKAWDISFKLTCWNRLVLFKKKISDNEKTKKSDSYSVFHLFCY
jgi:hypothetical protein